MIPTRIRRLLTGTAFVAAIALPQSVNAQRVVGRVLERGGGGPVSGAMVRLADASGPVGRPWLTAEDGRFRLDAAAAGTYRLVVERIGFATTEHLGVELSPNGIVSIDLVVETEAIALEGIEVEAARGGRCAPTADGAVTQLLWDEARKALEAATWTASEVELRFRVRVWDRQINPRTSQILYEETDERQTVGANSVQSLPPEELAAEGYVQARPGFLFWYAPDATVLLSDEFRETHCFGVAETDEEEGLFGLSFEPDGDRELPDVEGVLWLDTQTGRLDRVEFGYTGLRVPGANRAEGEVHFAELADGRWIVEEWFIRAPMQSGRVGTPGAVRRGSQAAVHEVGNRVEFVEGERFTWAPDIEPGAVAGTVYDSISRGPLAGAEVRVAGRRWRASTDLEGRFDLDGLPPGLHRISFTHPSLDSLGVQAGWITAEVEPGGRTEVELAVPRWVTLLAWSCGDRGSGALVGVVRRRDGLTVGGASVELLDSEGPDGQPLTDVSDQHGGYVFCQASDVSRVRASRGRSRSESIETRVTPETFSQSDLVLPPPPADRPSVPGAFRPAIVGNVLARETRQPLGGVSVELLNLEGEVVGDGITDEEGSFRILLDGPEDGVHLQVERLGYTGAVSDVLDLSDGTRRVEVLLPTEAIELEPVLVVVEGLDPKLEREGFYQRATTSPGLFVRRDDIEAVAPARTSDLLERAPGVQAFTDPLAGDLRRRIVFTRHVLASGERCYPAIYVDNQVLRVGGARDGPEAPAIEGIAPPEGDALLSLDELVPPHEIEAVEMYPTPGQVPRRFTGLGTRCGVIVVWTRQPG